MQSAADGGGRDRARRLGLGLTTVFEGLAAQTHVVLDLGTLTGTWKDDWGQSGQFLPQ